MSDHDEAAYRAALIALAEAGKELGGCRGCAGTCDACRRAVAARESVTSARAKLTPVAARFIEVDVAVFGPAGVGT